MINWKVRLKNPMFIAQLVLSVIMPILAYLGLTAEDLSSWAKLGEVLLKAVSSPYKMIYNYVDDNMPAWAKPTIQKMMDKGFLEGDENGKLGLTDELLRVFVTNDRAGIYDHRWDGKKS